MIIKGVMEREIEQLVMLYNQSLELTTGTPNWTAIPVVAQLNSNRYITSQANSFFVDMKLIKKAIMQPRRAWRETLNSVGAST